LEEYKEILKRLHVRPNLIGRVINLIRERPEEVKVRSSSEISADPKDDAFLPVCYESIIFNSAYTFMPALRRMAIIGHQFVKADWSRFSPTKAVNRYQ
jgi:hypothetical protein